MKATFNKTMLVLAVGLATQSAMAADNGGVNTSTSDSYTETLATRQYIGVDGSYLKVDSGRNVKDYGDGYSGFYGRQLANHWWWESAFGFYKTDTNLNPDRGFYQYHLMTGLSYAFGDRTGFTPYLIGQIGAIKHEVLPSSENDTTFGANVGIGAVTGPLFDNGLKIRGDVRYVYDNFDGASSVNARGNGPFGDVRFSLGLEFPLGFSKVVTKTKTIVKTREVPVQTNVIDSDGDGVPDNRDQCPNTIAGGKVDSKGCLITNQTISFNDILFELNSAQLTPDSERTLDKIAKSLKAQKDFNIEIDGNTDSTGSASYNMSLSQRRAESVRQYLIDQGVSASRLSAKGYGESNPVASNKTVSGRAMNRRVDFRVSDQK